jgi:hypothetical protein
LQNYNKGMGKQNKKTFIFLFSLQVDSFVSGNRCGQGSFTGIGYVRTPHFIEEAQP